MKPGDIAELAMWLDGRETPAQRKAHEMTVEQTMRDTEQVYRVQLGPITYTEKKPGEDRVPPVPDHIAGPNVRLLVAEAKVLKAMPMVVVTSFLADLELSDLTRLQAVTRRMHQKANPLAAPLSNEECNQMIEQLGPEAAIDTLRMAVQSKAFH